MERKDQTQTSSNLAIVRAFGGFLVVLGLIFAAAWLLNRQEANRFVNGNVVEGTIERIYEDDPPIVMVYFVDANGRSQTEYLENMTQSLRETLAEGDEVVAVQMLDSPSRIKLLEQVENRPSDAGGPVATAVLLLPGLFLLLQKRPYGSPENQQKMDVRHRHLAGGSIFLFAGFLMLIGFYATIADPDFHWLAKFIFGAFCLLTGGWLTWAGLATLRQTWHSK